MVWYSIKVSIDNNIEELLSQVVEVGNQNLGGSDHMHTILSQSTSAYASFIWESRAQANLYSQSSHFPFVKIRNQQQTVITSGVQRFQELKTSIIEIQLQYLFQGPDTLIIL